VQRLDDQPVGAHPGDEPVALRGGLQPVRQPSRGQLAVILAGDYWSAAWTAAARPSSGTLPSMRSPLT
jgi:hypothetical protein